MEVNLTPEQKELVRHAIETGRLHHEEDAVLEALTLWQERERARVELLAAVDAAELSLEHGEGKPITQESMVQLAEEIKKRGRARLARGSSPAH